MSNARRSGVDPLQALAAELQRDWPGDGAEVLQVRWPFMGRWGMINA